MRRFWLLFLVLLVGLTGALRGDTIQVVNAASFLQEAAFTPGTIVSVFGLNLSNTTAFATDAGNLPKTLGGVTLTVGGVPCSLFFVSPAQVNAQIDAGVPGGRQAVALTSPNGTFTTNVTIEAAGTPGVFSFSGTGTREGAIVNAETFERGPFQVKSGSGPTFLAIFATGLDVSAAPTVTIGGVVVPVQFFGNAPCCVGLQQVNVQLTEALEGAGRVEVAVNARGRMSNVVEAVIGSSEGPGREHRELAALAYVPGTSLALVVDTNADEVRVINVAQRRVIRTVALAKKAEPIAIGVNAAGTLAVVVERDRNKVEIIELTNFTVTGEVEVGRGPTGVAIASDLALVVNQDSDSVSVVNLTSKTVVKTIAVGRGPRSVAVDVAGGRAVVTNQLAGTLSVITLGSLTVTNTLNLGANARPQTVQIIPTLNLAVITEPSAGPDGKVMAVNLLTGTIASLNVNPERSGGASDIAVLGTTVYFANQTGGSITIAPVSIVGGVVQFNPTRVRAATGARALAIDTRDNLLLVTNQGSGNIVLIDLNTRQVVGRINVVRGESD